MTSSVQPTRAVAPPENDFRDFVVGFADPLARLAFVLTVESPTDPAASPPEVFAAKALAQVRRQWHDAYDSGAPEHIAIEALLSHLARRHHPGRRDKLSSLRAAGALTSAGPGDADRDLDLDLVREGLWQAFQELPLRHRVPLVFANPSVASRRLAGLDVPASFATERRQEALLDAALLTVRAALRLAPTTAAAADAMADDEIVAVMGEAIHEHASLEPAPLDPYPVVLEQARTHRRRTRSIAAAVVVVLALGAVGVARVSTPTKTRAGVQDLTTTSPARPLAGAQPTPASIGVGPLAAGAVVNWPVRGNAASEAELLANVRALFSANHPDMTGPAQILLAADTSDFRVAYVTAPSSNGVLQAWFYGPVGASELEEGAASFGGSLVANASVIAAGLVDPAGHTDLVVIAPTTTTGMSVADYDFSRPIGPFQALPESGGIALKKVSTGSVPTLRLYVIAGGQQLETDHMPVIALGTPAALVALRSQPPVAAVERGRADPVLLAEAMQVASVWAKQDPSVATNPVVLWGGTDAVGTKLLVLRIKLAIVDVVILEWSGDAPQVHGEILIHSTAPEVPISFAYRAVGRVRIGVIGPAGAARAVLDFGGKTSAPVALDPTGFASFPLTNPSPPQSNDPVNGLDVVAQVRLFDASGHQLETVPEPPTA